MISRSRVPEDLKGLLQSLLPGSKPGNRGGL
jgi:hypothetical protein